MVVFIDYPLRQQPHPSNVDRNLCPLCPSNLDVSFFSASIIDRTSTLPGTKIGLLSRLPIVTRGNLEYKKLHQLNQIRSDSVPLLCPRTNPCLLLRLSILTRAVGTVDAHPLPTQGGNHNSSLSTPSKLYTRPRNHRIWKHIEEVRPEP